MNASLSCNSFINQIIFTMKDPIMMIVGLLVLLTFLSCSEEEIVDGMSNEAIATVSATNGRSYNSNKQVIVLAAPSVDNAYYKEVFEDIVDFQVEYANRIDGRDEVIILVDRKTRKYYDGRVEEYVLVDANIGDIWIRDFSPVIPGAQVKFNYLPDYLDRADANYIDNSFENWYRNVGLVYGKKSRLILDGGNVVDNGNGRIVVTDRFLYDNPRYNKRSAKRILKKLLKATEVAIIKETPEDATGHADGMLMWVEENKLLLHDQPASVKSKILKELKSSFPGVEIVIVPDYYQFEEWGGFTSACNIYVNSLVTNNYIYVPTFNDSHDKEMIDFIQSHTTKEVVEVAAEKVCFMGGSVRCLSWQLDGTFAEDILYE